MAKGYKTKEDKAKSDEQNAGQLQSLTQMVVQAGQHLRQLQDEVSMLANLLRYTASEKPAREVGFAVIDCLGYLKNEDGSRGARFDGASLLTHAVDLSHPEHYIPGFVSSLIGKSAGDVYSVDLTFPENYTNKDIAGKTLHFRISVIKVLEAVGNNSIILNELNA